MLAPACQDRPEILGKHLFGLMPAALSSRHFVFSEGGDFVTGSQLRQVRGGGGRVVKHTQKEGGKVSKDRNICTKAEHEEEDVSKISGMMEESLTRSESTQDRGLWTWRGEERGDSAQAHLLKRMSCYL